MSLIFKNYVQEGQDKSNGRYFFNFFRPIAYLGVYILRKGMNYVDQSWLNL